MPNSERSLSKVGPKGWLAVAVAPPLVLVLLDAMDVIGFEAVRYLFLVSIAWTIVFAFVSWKQLDDPSREAYKFASFWGIGSGLGIGGLVLFVCIAFPGATGDLIQSWIDGYIALKSPASEGWRPGAVGYYLGIASIVVVQLALFLFVWLGWWAHQRLGTKSD